MKFLIWVWALLPLCLAAQTSATPDEHALSVKYRGDVVRLSRELTEPFPEQADKVRAISRWMAENITYDWRLANRIEAGKANIPSFKCQPRINCEEAKRNFNDKLVAKTLSSGKGVCQHYALVFEEMCNMSGITSTIVKGKGRALLYLPDDKIKLKTESHAWNAVFIDSTWYFMDLTWASGSAYMNKRMTKLAGFHKKFDAAWLFARPLEFKYDHRPDSTYRWYDDREYSADRFRTAPYTNRTTGAWHFGNITPEEKLEGNIMGDTLEFRIELLPDSPTEGIPMIKVHGKNYSNGLCTVRREGNVLVINHVITKLRLSSLFFTVGGQRIFFRLKSDE